MFERRTGQKRIYLLDEARGVCIILMVIYHALYNLVYLFGVELSFWPLCLRLQPFLAGSFIVISGISCRFSHNNIRRGFFTLAMGAAVSLVTFFFMPSQMIWFGILHFLGSAMILFGLLRRFLDRLPAPAGTAVFAALFLATRHVPSGLLGGGFLPQVPLPASWYERPWFMVLGFGGIGADYFPLIPWLFLFIAGAYLGLRVTTNRLPEGCYRVHLPWLTYLGRHTLVVYLLHQPLIYGILTLVFRFIKNT